MKVSAQSTDTCSLEIENLEGARQREKNFTILPMERMYQMSFLSRSRSGEKNQNGITNCVSDPLSSWRERVLHIACFFRFRNLLVYPVLDKEFHLLVSHPMMVIGA